MTDIATPPKRHDTRNPLTCCPRCHTAELLGRAMRRPAFRYSKLDAVETPSTYDMFHGDERVGTLSRRRGSGRQTYEIRMETYTGDEELLAPSLRDARLLAEETYTASWLEGIPAIRGPVREL